MKVDALETNWIKISKDTAFAEDDIAEDIGASRDAESAANSA